MAADEKQVSALIKRHEQIKRWQDSDTNLEPILPKRNKTAVQFQDGCVFLAACSSGDKAEVDKLLRNVRSADINTANVDGLTALHQACIDDNLEMVEFLVEHGANIDVCDNEGWTPLHATASCAFLEIARYLINHNANVAAVNNDGDLPIDIAENEDMENLLQKEMDRKGIDAEAARCGEEQRMLEDANLWLSDKTVREVEHPKTGATALHVAAAKGYIKVMNLLLEAGVKINAEDNDGWTPLHAAVHWGQKEACQILVNNMCDMGHKNKAGHTALDLAENDMMKLLEELKEKQASIRNEQEKATDIILPSGYGGKRSSSSVTRMSGDQKQILHHASEKEHSASLYPRKTDGKSTEDFETDHPNDKIKQGPQQPQLPVPTTVSTSTTTVLSERNSEDGSATVVQLHRPANMTTTTTTTTTVLSRPNSEDGSAAVVQLRQPAMTTTTTATGTEMVQPPTVATSSSGIELRRPASVATSTTTATGTEMVQPPTVATSSSGIELRRPASVATSTTTATGTEMVQPLSVATSSCSLELRRPASVATSTPGMELLHSTNMAAPTTGVKLRRPHLSKIDGLSEEDRPTSIISTSTTSSVTPPTSPTTTDTSSATPTKDIDKTAVLSTRPLSISKGDKISDLNGTSVQDSATKKPTKSLGTGRDLVSRFISVPVHLPTEKLQERLAQGRTSSSGSTGISTATTAPSTTTTSTTTTFSTKSTTDADAKPADRDTNTFGQSYSGFRGSFSSRSNNYVPFYMQRQQREAQAGSSDDKSTSLEPVHDRGSVSGITSETTVSSPTLNPASVSAGTNSVFKRSYEPPKRDEETETQRKARAKHARQTRRSTQGVSLEDIEKAEESLNRDKNTSSAPATSSQTSSSRNSVITKETTSVGNGVAASTTVIPTASTTGIPTASTTTTISSSARASDPEDKSIISGYRRWASEDKTDSTDASNIGGSYRRARVDRENNSTTSVPDVTASYVPRSQRMSAALPVTDTVSSAPPSQSLLQASIKAQDEPKKDESGTQEKKEEKKESTSLRARRQRRERRSTGIGLDNEGGENGGENKPEDDDQNDNIGSVQDGYENSNSVHLPQRSKSSMEVTKSSGQLEIDYKKKYDEEKTENERLKKELDSAKRGLQDAKTELDRANRQKDNTRNSDRDKRILEKKLTDMEEELKNVESLKADNQRLKAENGALIRVISKLSK